MQLDELDVQKVPHVCSLGNIHRRTNKNIAKYWLTNKYKHWNPKNSKYDTDKRSTLLWQRTSWQWNQKLTDPCWDEVSTLEGFNQSHNSLSEFSRSLARPSAHAWIWGQVQLIIGEMLTWCIWIPLIQIWADERPIVIWRLLYWHTTGKKTSFYLIFGNGAIGRCIKRAIFRCAWQHQVVQGNFNRPPVTSNLASERDFEAVKFMIRLIPTLFGIEMLCKCRVNLAGRSSWCHPSVGLEQ